jgi:hypothetical protein
MRKIFILIKFSYKGEFNDVIATSLNISSLRELINNQNLGGSWDSSYLNYNIQYGDSYCIYSRYVM